LTRGGLQTSVIAPGKVGEWHFPDLRGKPAEHWVRRKLLESERAPSEVSNILIDHRREM
jgi:hypothetical protein